jgi:hypothetical protein
MEARGDDPSAFGLGLEAEQTPVQPAATEWFASVDGAPVGPLTTDELVSRIATGVLDWDAHLWREGYAEWRTVGDSDTIVRAVASSRSSLDESARADSTERTTLPQDADDDAPTTATMDESPTNATADDSPTRVAYDETPTRMFSSQSASPMDGLQPVARTTFASRGPSANGSRPPGELSAARAAKSAGSYAPGTLQAAGHPAQGYASYEQHPAPIGLPYEPPLHQGFTGSAQPIPMHGRAPSSVVPMSGYAGGEGSGLIDIRALASLAAQSQSRQQPMRPQQSSRSEARAYERLPAMQGQVAEPSYELGEAEQSAEADPLASFGSNHGVAFAALDSIAPVSRKQRPKDATVPLAILTGASMVAAAVFAALYVTRATPASSPVVSAAQPVVVAAPVAPSEPAAAPAEPAKAIEAEPEEVAASDKPAAEREPLAAAPILPVVEEAEKNSAPRGAKRAAAQRKQRAGRSEAEPEAEADEASEAEPVAAAKTEAKPPTVDDILLGDGDREPAAAAQPATATPPKAAKTESASRSIDDLLDIAVTEKKAAPAASALAEAPTRNDVLAAMRGIESEVRACAKDPTLQGTANVAITVIGSSGKVTSADVTGIQGEVGSCIARVARKASFSPFTRDRFSVSYPYRFKP